MGVGQQCQGAADEARVAEETAAARFGGRNGAGKIVGGRARQAGEGGSAQGAALRAAEHDAVLQAGGHPAVVAGQVLVHKHALANAAAVVERAVQRIACGVGIGHAGPVAEGLDVHHVDGAAVAAGAVAVEERRDVHHHRAVAVLIVPIVLRRRVFSAVELGEAGGQLGRDAHAEALLAGHADVVDQAGAATRADADAVGEGDGRTVRGLDGAGDKGAHWMLQVAWSWTVTVMPSAMAMGPALAAL